MLEVYAAIRNRNDLYGGTVGEIAKRYHGLGFDIRQFIFAASVFEELGLIGFDGDVLTVSRGIKVNLEDSALYVKVKALQSGRS